MIVDPQSQSMATDVPQESPPSYDVATDDGNSNPPLSIPKPTQNLDDKRPAEETPIQLHGGVVGPSHIMQPGYIHPPVVHHYVNPTTGEHVASLLPPNHPEMVCLQAGMHIPQTNYGILGILAAVFWFPFGIGLCLLDRHMKCTRCGATLNEGLCS